MDKSNYIFRWGDYQPHLTIQANINSFIKFGHIPWNDTRNIIEVSRKNAISCFHSREDLAKDKEESKKLLDKEFSSKFISDLEEAYEKNWNFFNSINDIDFSSLSNEELYNFLVKAVDSWSFVIGYFRASQEEPIFYLFEELKKHFSDDEIATLMISPELDVMNKEQLDWKELSNQEYSEDKLLDHAKKYPWTVMCHFTYEDVIDTLTQRYKAHLDFSDIVKEKNELRKKQEMIMEKLFK